MSADPGRRPRVRPAIRRLAIGALLVLTPLAAHTIWDHVELRRLIREIDRIRESGEPVTALEAAGGYRALTSEERRAASYMLAAGMLAFSEPWQLGDLQQVHDWLSGMAGSPDMLDEVAARMSARAERERDATALADAAARLPFRAFQPGTESNYRAQSLAQASFAIGVRTVSLSLQGDGDAAADSAISGLQYRRALRDVILNIGDHETAAVLSFSAPSAAQLERLQQALEGEDDADRLLEDLLRTRADYLEQIWRRYYGTDPSVPQAFLIRRLGVGESLWRPWLSRRIAHTLRIWADVIDAARTPWPQKLKAAEDVRRRYEAEANPAAGPMWLSPGASAAAVWYGPALALEQLRRATGVYAGGPLYGPGQLILDRSARIAVALERYRRDHDGTLPDTLDGLVPDYLSDVPADPLTGEPLRYRAGPDAYTVYSVGTDLTDNGGALVQPSPPGAARPLTAGPDIGIRVLTRS